MNNFLMTALATPFDKHEIDKTSYARLVEYQVSAKTDALLAVGATAECMSLTQCEKRLLVGLARTIAPNTALCVGVGSNIPYVEEETEQALKLGADALMLCPPAFCKCTKKGFISYVDKILAVTKTTPLILYNAPSRCGYNLNAEVLTELAAKGIACIKDAGTDLHYTENISRFLPVMCGNDGAIEKFENYCGLISVVSNVAPQITKRALCAEETELFYTLTKLSTTEINPVPIKYMLYKKGIFSSYETRLPLSEASQETQKSIDETDLGEII